MKIVFVVSLLSAGGAERVLSELAKRWSETHEVTVVTLGKGEDFYGVGDKVKRVRLDITRHRWYNPLPHIRLVRALRAAIRRENPDWVVSFVLKTNIFALLANIGTGYPIVVCEHSQIGRSDIDGRVSFARRLTYPLATKIAVLSESIRGEFAAKYPTIPISKVFVVPNPIELPPAPARENTIPVEGSNPSVISLGRFVDVKNFKALVSAFALVAKKLPAARLVIYGDGPEREVVRALVGELGLEESVSLPGLTDDVPKALSGADVFAITSRLEGMPMALLEAMHAGIPACGFDAPGVRDFLTDGYNGYKVPFGDLEALSSALVRLLESPAERERLGGNARKYVGAFTPENVDAVWFREVLTETRP